MMKTITFSWEGQRFEIEVAENASAEVIVRACCGKVGKIYGPHYHLVGDVGHYALVDDNRAE